MHSTQNYTLFIYFHMLIVKVSHNSLCFILYLKLSSFHSETLDGDQSVYKQILDHFKDLQRFHQKLARISESGVHEDTNTFESKQRIF